MNELMRKLLWLPEQASTMAPAVDHLHYFVITVTMVVSALIGGAAIGFYVKYRWKGRIGAKGEPVYTTFLGETLIIGVPAFFFLLVVRHRLSRLHQAADAAGRLDGRLRDGQAVDVEVRLSRGAQRRQRAARAGASPGAPAHDLARRHPLVLRARVPHQAGRAARPLHRDLVRGDQAGTLSRSTAPRSAAPATRRCAPRSSSWSRPSSTSGSREQRDQSRPRQKDGTKVAVEDRDPHAT